MKFPAFPGPELVNREGLVKRALKDDHKNEIFDSAIIIIGLQLQEPITDNQFVGVKFIPIRFHYMSNNRTLRPASGRKLQPCLGL